MTDEQRGELEAAQRQSRSVRHWKRYQAVLLRVEGTPVAVVAQTLGWRARPASSPSGGLCNQLLKAGPARS